MMYPWDPRGWNRNRSNGRLYYLLAVLLVVLATLFGVLNGCAGEIEMEMAPPASTPTSTSQPSASAAAQGQLAASVVAQLESRIAAQLIGIQSNRTVDHALDGGQLVVLLAVIAGSHRREMRRIGKVAKAK